MRIMQIKKLFLQNFRNYEREEFDFSDGLNVLFGKNAQGKTNCAEAVFYLVIITRRERKVKHVRVSCDELQPSAEQRTAQ